MRLEQQFARIEQVIGRDAGRGFSWGEMVDFSAAVYSLFQARSVLIVTGFCIAGVKLGETDGPAGAAILARALMLLGQEVMVVTDSYSVPLVTACATTLSLSLPLEQIPFHHAQGFCQELLSRIQPTHVVGLERPSRAKDGRCYSMRGEDVTDLVPDTDGLFADASPAVTIGIGDGGNELGMGKIGASFAGSVPLGDKIWASTRADYLIPAGVSNWGSYGLTAALSMLGGKNLLHSPDEEEALIKAMIACGGVDGLTKKPQPSVDGLGSDVHMQVVADLGAIVAPWLAPAGRRIR